jgi:hypothetical protein
VGEHGGQDTSSNGELGGGREPAGDTMGAGQLGGEGRGGMEGQGVMEVMEVEGHFEQGEGLEWRVGPAEGQGALRCKGRGGDEVEKH